MAAKAESNREQHLNKFEATSRELAEKVDRIQDGTLDRSDQEDVIHGVYKFLDEVRGAVTQARIDGDAEILVWAREVASYWQSALTSVFEIPLDVRQRIGITTDDAYLSADFRVREHLSRQAYRIGATRKIRTLLEQVRYYTANPERIHKEISSKDPERARDWYDACEFFGLDVLFGRIELKSVVFEQESLETLDRGYLEDMVRLHAYLLWEKSQVGWAPECSDTFYQAAEKNVFERIRSSEERDGALAGFISQWYKNRLQIAESATHDSLERVLRKTQRLCHESNLFWPQAQSIAKRQTELFEQHIVIAIEEGDKKSVDAVVDSVTGCSEWLFRRCATALEAIALSHCVAQPE
jgi:hypothetical protein